MSVSRQVTRQARATPRGASGRPHSRAAYLAPVRLQVNGFAAVLVSLPVVSFLGIGRGAIAEEHMVLGV